MRLINPNSSTILGLAVFALAALLGCATESGLTPTESALSGDSSSFSAVGLSQAQSEFAGSGIRIAVRIKPGSPLVATQLALDPPSMAAEPERVEANVTAIDVTDIGGTITTDLGGLQITFDGSTMFSRQDPDDEDAAALTSDEFAAAVRAALAAGGRLHILARRPAPASPQAPDDGTFLAGQIRVGGASDVLAIDLNAGRLNLELNSSPPPDAFLKLLGLTIEIRVSDGTTRIGHRSDRPGQRVKFEGRVKSVNLDRQAFILASGAVVLITNETVIVPNDGIATLNDVAEALRAGAVIEAEGVGTVVSREPRVLRALKVKFETHRPLFDFRGLVKAVDAAGGKLVLSNGATLCVTDRTVISQDGDLKTLAEVAEALAAGKRVAATGVATPAPNDAGCRAVVLKVRFVLVPIFPPPVVVFRDWVKAVDVTAQTMTLSSGATLCFTEHSVISEQGAFKTLEEVAAALTAGTRVGAVGAASPGPTTSGCRATVVRVLFSVGLPTPILEFDETVKAVDTGAEAWS